MRRLLGGAPTTRDLANELAEGRDTEHVWPLTPNMPSIFASISPYPQPFFLCAVFVSEDDGDYTFAKVIPANP